MRPRTILLLVVISLLLAGATASSANPTTEARPVNDKDPLALPAHMDGGVGTDECGGDAPDTTSCTTGPHWIMGGHASHGFPTNQGSFNGTLVSSIQSIVPFYEQARTFRCDFNEGELEECTSTGSFPSTPSVFIHTCNAYELGTSTPGGTGSWKCYVEHS